MRSGAGRQLRRLLLYIRPLTRRRARPDRTTAPARQAFRSRAQARAMGAGTSRTDCVTYSIPFQPTQAFTTAEGQIVGLRVRRRIVLLRDWKR